MTEAEGPSVTEYILSLSQRKCRHVHIKGLTVSNGSNLTNVSEGLQNLPLWIRPEEHGDLLQGDL